MGSQSISYACEGSICIFVTVCRRSFQFLKLQHLKRTQESYCLFRAILSIRMSNDFLFWSKCYSSAALTSGSDLEKVWEGNPGLPPVSPPFLTLCMCFTFRWSLWHFAKRTHHPHVSDSSSLPRQIFLTACPSVSLSILLLPVCSCSSLFLFSQKLLSSHIAQ